MFRTYCANRAVTVNELCNEAGITTRAFYKRFAKFKRWCDVGTLSPRLDIESAIAMAEQASAFRERHRRGVATRKLMEQRNKATNPYKENK